MICSCGGQTRKTYEQAEGLKLSYQRCLSCGRCDRWVLKINAGAKLTGEEARHTYSNRPKTWTSYDIKC